MKFLVLIPARYESSRFPGKPLAKIGGEEMIVRVCRQVAKTGFDLAVATDNKEIYDCVERNGFRAVMTSSDHRSGTERVEEAYRNLGSDADVVINVQGDEPFIQPAQIEKLAGIFTSRPDTRIATLAKRFDPKAGFDALFDPNLVKLTFSHDKNALYFSRTHTHTHLPHSHLFPGPFSSSHCPSSIRKALRPQCYRQVQGSLTVSSHREKEQEGYLDI